MTSRELTSVALALLGITVGLRSLTILAGSLTTISTLTAISRSSLPFSAAFQILAVACLSAVAFSIIPARIILRNRDRWAERLFPASSPDSLFNVSTLYVTGLLLLGIYFILLGVGSGALGLPLIFSPSETASLNGWSQVSRGIVLPIAGLVIISRGRSLSRSDPR